MASSEDASPGGKNIKIDTGGEKDTMYGAQQQNANIIIIILITALGGMNAGYHLFISDTATPLLRNDNILILPIHESFYKYGSLFIGCIIGSFVAGYLCDLHGRKQTIIYAEWIMFFSLLFLQIGNYVSIFIFRIGLGMATGIFNLAIPLYMAEVVKSHMRGAILVLFSVASSMGMIIAFLFQTQLEGGPIGPGTWTWRDFNWLALPVPLIMYLFTDIVYHLPKSQAWITLIENDIKENKLSRNRNSVGYDIENEDDESSSLLGNNNKNNSNATTGMAFVTDQTLQKSCFQYSSDLFKLIKSKPRYYASCLSVISLSALNVFAGGNISLFEFETLILPVFGNKDKFNWVSIGLCHLLSCCLAMALVDTVGRRPLLSIGAFATAFFNMVIGVLISFSPARSANAFTTIVFFFYIASYQFGPQSMLYVLSCEILPIRVRSIGLSITYAVLYFLQSIIIGVYVISDNRTIRTGGVGGVGIWFYIYSVLTFVLTGGLMYLLPKETKKISLNEIENFK
eukprot:g8710.t1